jgi:hypothetical protein
MTRPNRYNDASQPQNALGHPAGRWLTILSSLGIEAIACSSWVRLAVMIMTMPRLGLNGKKQQRN